MDVYVRKCSRRISPWRQSLSKANLFHGPWFFCPKNAPKIRMGILPQCLTKPACASISAPGTRPALKDFSERKLWKEKNGPKNKNSRTALCGSDFFREDVFIGKFLCGLRPRPSGRTSPYPAIPAGYQTRAQDAKPRRALLPIWLAGRRLVAAKYFFHEPVLRIALFRDISASPRKHPKLSRRFAWKERKKSAGSAQA